MDLKATLKELDGKPVMEGDKEMTVGKTLAKMLSVTQGSTDPLRSHILAVKFYSEETMELNASDKAFVTDVVKKSGGWPLVVGQILLLIGEK